MLSIRAPPAFCRLPRAGHGPLPRAGRWPRGSRLSRRSETGERVRRTLIRPRPAQQARGWHRPPSAETGLKRLGASRARLPIETRYAVAIETAVRSAGDSAIRKIEKLRSSASLAPGAFGCGGTRISPNLRRAARSVASKNCGDATGHCVRHREVQFRVLFDRRRGVRLLFLRK